MERPQPLPRSVLLDAWTKFADDPGRPFTIPGHKQRAGDIWPELGRALTGDVPLFGGLATIKESAALLESAEATVAMQWGADWCRFSTGGSTHANQAVALSVAHPGDTVLVVRNAHRSTLSGLILAGLIPAWITPRLHPGLGIPLGITVADLRAALAANPHAKALFLVEPSYVGMVSDLAALVALAHQQGVAVIVDQAWGAHFGFHPAYPPHALAAGADALVTSAHKTLAAYSQASLVLARTERIDVDRLERGFGASNTTSPAGSILASTDAACALLASELGAVLLGELVTTVADARERLRAGIPGAMLLEADDPAKLVVLLADTAVNGLEVERRLETAGFGLEQADRDTLVPIVTMIDSPQGVAALCDAMIAAANEAPVEERGVIDVRAPHALPPAPLTPREAFFAEHETVAASNAIGRVSAEVIAPYPPGVPVLVPGETITAETVEALQAAARSGVRIAYAADPSLASYQVVS